MSQTRTMEEAHPTAELPAWARRLTPRRFAFVKEYLVDLSPRRAAQRAGLSTTPNGASSVAKRMLLEPEVAQAIADALVDQAGVTQSRVLQELAAIAFSRADDVATVVGN